MVSSEREAVERDMEGEGRSGYLLPVLGSGQKNFKLMVKLGSGKWNLISKGRMSPSLFRKDVFCVVVNTRVCIGAPYEVKEPALAKVVKEPHVCKSGPFKGYWKTVVKIV